jgi:DNA-binding SARP family transcriptional activator
MGIGVLGPLSIDGVAYRPGAARRRCSPALAVHPGEVLSAEQLAEVLWPDTPPATWLKVTRAAWSGSA